MANLRTRFQTRSREAFHSNSEKEIEKLITICREASRLHKEIKAHRNEELGGHVIGLVDSVNSHVGQINVKVYHDDNSYHLEPVALMHVFQLEVEGWDGNWKKAESLTENISENKESGKEEAEADNEVKADKDKEE